MEHLTLPDAYKSSPLADESRKRAQRASKEDHLELSIATPGLQRRQRRKGITNRDLRLWLEATGESNQTSTSSDSSPALSSVSPDKEPLRCHWPVPSPLEEPSRPPGAMPCLKVLVFDENELSDVGLATLRRTAGLARMALPVGFCNLGGFLLSSGLVCRGNTT